MVKRAKHIRTDKVMTDLLDTFRADAENITGRKPSYTDATRYIGSFLIQEDLYPWAVKGLKKKRRGGFL